MSLTNLYKLSAVVTPGGQISQIVNQDYQTGLQEVLQGGSGSVDPEMVTLGEVKPMLSFGTTAIATALGLVGLGLYNIASATDFYFRKMDQGGLIAAGASHIKMTVQRGMIVPRTIDARQGGDPSTIAYDLIPRSIDGETAPISIAVNQTLPTIAVVNELFTLGPVTINGTALGGGQSQRWDFGNAEEVRGADGQAYATYVGVASRRPKCAINGFDIAALNTFGLEGVSITTFTTYLRKMKEGGTRVPVGTAQHIRIQGTKGMLLPRGARGDSEKPLEGEWNICPAWDGTNDILSINTAAAIV